MRRSRVFWRRPARIERPTLLLSFALPVSATSGPSVFVPPLTPPHLLFIQSTLHRSTNSSPLLFRFRSDSALDAFCVSPPAPTLSLRAKKQKNLLLLPTPPPPLGSSVSFAIFIRRSAQKLFPSVLFSPPPSFYSSAPIRPLLSRPKDQISSSSSLKRCTSASNSELAALFGRMQFPLAASSFLLRQRFG